MCLSAARWASVGSKQAAMRSQCPGGAWAPVANRACGGKCRGGRSNDKVRHMTGRGSPTSVSKARQLSCKNKVRPAFSSRGSAAHLRILRLVVQRDGHLPALHSAGLNSGSAGQAEGQHSCVQPLHHFIHTKRNAHAHT